MSRAAATVAIVAVAVVCIIINLAAPHQGDAPHRSHKVTMFLEDVHAATDLGDLYTDDELVHIGDKVCDAFAAGASRDEVLDAFAPYRNDTDLSSLAGSAVGYFCPEYA